MDAVLRTFMAHARAQTILVKHMGEQATAFDLLSICIPNYRMDHVLLLA